MYYVADASLVIIGAVMLIRQRATLVVVVGEKEYKKHTIVD